MEQTELILRAPSRPLTADEKAAALARLAREPEPDLTAWRQEGDRRWAAIIDAAEAATRARPDWQSL